jgi:hypothetical protein
MNESPPGNGNGGRQAAGPGNENYTSRIPDRTLLGNTRRKKPFAATSKKKLPQREPEDDFCVVSFRIRDDDDRLWQETYFFVGTRAQLGKLIPAAPPGGRFYQGNKARAIIQRAITSAQEGYQP